MAGLAALTIAGCIEGIPLPELIPQTEVSYGGRIFLIDSTRDAPPSGGSCTRIGVQVTPESGTSTAATTVASRDWIASPINARVPHSCYVEAMPRTLKVDVVETTNALFQLCFDSGQCKAPDPNKANKNQVCTSEADFPDCPVVELGQDAASRFCRFVGRRLPTGLEHIAIRQAGLADPETARFPAYPTEPTPLASCDDAVLRANSCLKPRPVLREGQPTGGARNDRLAVGSGNLFDLVGNVSEWTADLFPTSRGSAANLPWFCAAALPGSETGFNSENPPRCPTGKACVYAQYRPDESLPLRTDWPFCVLPESGQFVGSQGALFGGSYRDDSKDAEVVGVFGRRVEPNPVELPDTTRAREYGLRCVGDRAPGADGNLPDFDDTMELKLAE